MASPQPVNDTSKTNNSTSKAISVGILIVVLIIIIVYVIVMYELFTNQEFIFAPFTPPVPSDPHFFPLGTVTPLSQEQINHRNAIILASVGMAP